MDSGLYAACAALVARTQSLEVAANNLENTSSAGYRRQQVTFKSALSDAGVNRGSSLNRAVNDFAVLGDSRTDISQGNLDLTDNDLDCAIDGDGFFGVETKAGVRYTRDGRFQLSPTRELTTAEGDRILGEEGPLRIPPGDLVVSNDGTLSVDGAVVGKLKLVSFAAGTPLKAEGRAYYAAPLERARPSLTSMVKQGSVEGSNVNPVLSAVDLISLQRHSELLQRTLSMFHSDLNRVAAEELPRL